MVREKITAFGRYLICIALLATASACGHVYSFRSEPSEAQLYLNDTLIGKTPIDVPTGDLPPTPNIRVKLVKEGHKTFEGVIPGPSISTMKADLFIALNRGEDETDKLNRLMGYIINAQKLVLTQKYADAMKLADQALAESPKYTYAQLLKASILFLNKDYSSSLAQFQKVLELDPTNTEAIRMINYIKTTGGAGPAPDRLPAGSAQ